MNIIIVGAGEIGRHLAESLSNQQHNIAGIDQSEKLTSDLDEQLDAQIICENGASVTALVEAQVAECDLFLALTSDDHTNLVSASIAKALGARKSIARVHYGVQREEWLFDYKKHFKIDYLFSSERLAAVELAKYVRNPEKKFVEELARGRIELQQTFVSPMCDAVDNTLADLKLPPRVQSGAKLRLKGKGVAKRDGAKGDLFVHVQLRLPDGHDHAAIEKALAEVEQQYMENPRAHLKNR